MSTRTILLTPIDAWFFRDGRPYNQGESGQTDVRSLFPPFAPTVVGTLRAALAVGQGWNGRESWANELHPFSATASMTSASCSSTGRFSCGTANAFSQCRCICWVVQRITRPWHSLSGRLLRSSHRISSAPFWKATWGQFVFLFPSDRRANVDN